MDVRGDLLPRCPPRLLPPSHCLEINYKVTARREPSYRILTVPSCPLLERRWSVLYLQTFLFLFFLPPGGKSAKQKPQQQRNLEQWTTHKRRALLMCTVHAAGFW